MTAREEVLRAARSLHGRGHELFSPAEVVREAHAQGAVSADVTLRTHIISYMCANIETEQGGRWDDLERVGRGAYRLRPATLDERPAPPPPPLITGTGGDRPWDWEGNVQATLVGHLIGEGWTIASTADTDWQEQGVDVHARLVPVDLYVEVKGYPSRTYVRGARRGQPKTTAPSVQARHWYAGALLSAMLLRDAHVEAGVGMCFPDAGTYRRLWSRTRASLHELRIEVWWVAADGAVST